MCPVGAVSNMTWSKALAVAAAEEPGELVEGGDLRRASAGELLAQSAGSRVARRPRGTARSRARDTPRRRPPGRCSSPEAGHARHLASARFAELDVRASRRGSTPDRCSRAGPACRVGERDRGRARERRLADAALAGEEQVPRRCEERGHRADFLETDETISSGSLCTRTATSIPRRTLCVTMQKSSKVARQPASAG